MDALEQLESPDEKMLAARAQRFVEGFAWCERVTGCSHEFAIGHILGVFRVHLVPVRDRSADPVVWVVVGDVPPAYLAYDEGDTWQLALKGYVAEMQLWVTATRTGDSVKDLIPVSVPPTVEYADMLESRLRFILERIVDVDPDTLNVL